MTNRNDESAYDLFTTANKKEGSKVEWNSEGHVNDPNFIKADCLYYMNTFSSELLYEEGVKEILMELFDSVNNDNYKIAEQILRNVKLKE